MDLRLNLKKRKEKEDLMLSWLMQLHGRSLLLLFFSK